MLVLTWVPRLVFASASLWAVKLGPVLVLLSEPKLELWLVLQLVAASVQMLVRALVPELASGSGLAWGLASVPVWARVVALGCHW